MHCTEIVSISIFAGNCPISDRNENRYNGFQRVKDYNFMGVIYFLHFEMTWKLQLKFGLTYNFSYNVFFCKFDTGKINIFCMHIFGIFLYITFINCDV